MVHETIDGERLPAVGVGDGGVARIVYDQLVVEGLVVEVDIVEGLIGPVLHAEGDDLLSDVVAQCGGGTEGVVRGGQGRIVAQCREQRVKAGLGWNDARGILIPVRQYAVGGIGDGLLAGRGNVDEGKDVLRNAVEIRRVSTQGMAQQQGLCGLVVHGPGVVHGHGDVVEVPGVNGGTGEVIPDPHQLGLDPFVGHVVLVLLRCDCAPRNERHRQQQRECDGVETSVESCVHARCHCSLKDTTPVAKWLATGVTRRRWKGNVVGGEGLEPPTPSV